MIFDWCRNLGSRAISWTVRQVLMAAELYRLQRENERLNREGEQMRRQIEIVETRTAETLGADMPVREPPEAESRTPQYEAEIRFETMDTSTAPKN